MEKNQSHSPSELQKEMEEAALLKTIRKESLLKAPEGYYEQLNARILERIEERQNLKSGTPVFSISPVARWTSIAAAIALFFFVGYQFRFASNSEMALSSKPLPVETVASMDSLLINNPEIQSIDEHILAEEFMSSAQQLQADSSYDQEEWTEYLLMHADNDLLIESL